MVKATPAYPPPGSDPSLPPVHPTLHPPRTITPLAVVKLTAERLYQPLKSLFSSCLQWQGRTVIRSIC